MNRVNQKLHQEQFNSDLVRMIARLSVPSFITVVVAAVLWLIWMLDVSIEDASAPVRIVLGGLFTVGFFAIVVQIVTVPLAAIRLFKGFRRTPVKARLVS